MSSMEIINGEAVECFTMDELIKQHNDERRRFVNHELEKAIELIKEQNWVKLFHKASFVPELFPIVMDYYDKIPYDNKADYLIHLYSDGGDRYQKIRKALKELPKYGKPTLPKFIADKEYITVYRAGEEPIDKAHNRISWTRSKKVANFFLNEWYGRHAKYLYQAKIKTKDIIAYSNDRKEQEVMQYRKVYDIRLIDTVSNPKASI